MWSCPRKPGRSRSCSSPPCSPDSAKASPSAARWAEINAIAPPDHKAEVLSAIYVVIYTGVALPIIGVGVLAVGVGLLTAVQIFAWIVAAIALLGMVIQRVDTRRPNRLQPAPERSRA